MRAQQKSRSQDRIDYMNYMEFCGEGLINEFKFWDIIKRQNSRNYSRFGDVVRMERLQKDTGVHKHNIYEYADIYTMFYIMHICNII